MEPIGANSLPISEPWTAHGMGPASGFAASATSSSLRNWCESKDSRSPSGSSPESPGVMAVSESDFELEQDCHGVPASVSVDCAAANGPDDPDTEDDGEHGRSQTDRPKSKAKSKAKAKGKAKAGAVGRPSGTGKAAKGVPKNKRQCQGCMKLFDISAFPPSGAYCWKDKRALDNLARAAKAQGCKEWYDQLKKDPKQFAVLLKSYHLKCPDAAAGKRRKPPAMLELQEIVRTITSVIRDDVGEMMHEAAFVHWATKPKNLGLSFKEAEARFKELLEEGDAITDDEGPPKSMRRVRVKVKSLVTYRDAFEKSKQQTVSEKVKKSASEEDIQKSLQKVMTGHEDIGGCHSAASSLSEIAKGMVATKGDDNAFSGKNMVMGNIKGLLPPEKADEDESADEADGEEEEADSDEEEEGCISDRTPKKSKRRAEDSLKEEPSAKKGRWFCVDEGIAGGLRKVTNWKESTLNAYSTQRQAADVVLKKVEASQEMQVAVGNEVAILRTRMQTLTMVCEGNSSELHDHLAKFGRGEKRSADCGSLSTASVASQSAEGVRHRLGTAPPCKNYKDLVTIASLVSYESEIESCFTKEEMLDVEKRFKNVCKNITDLIGNQIRITHHIFSVEGICLC